MHIKNILPFLYALAFCAFLMSGCDEKPKNPVSEYGDTMMDSYKKGIKAGESGNLDAVRKAVQAYRAANDKYPAALEDVGGLIGSEVDFSKYEYNPDTGQVSLKK